MAWLVDPKKWDDAWHRQLSYPAKIVFDACLTSRLRLSLPGLLSNACEFSLSAVTGCPIEDMKGALVELAEPDIAGKQHLFFDPIHRVIRLPAAPKYNKADNPNILTKWFKEWCDTPDCQLRWDHLESIRDGVNFRKESMVVAWESDFGRVMSAYSNGQKLLTYAELGGSGDEGDQPKRGRGSKPAPSSPNGGGKPPVAAGGSKPSSQPLGNRSNGSGNGSSALPFPIIQEIMDSAQRFPEPLDPDPDPDPNSISNSHSDPDPERERLPKPFTETVQHERKAEPTGYVGIFGGRDEDSGDPESHPATASPERRRQFELAGWKLSPIGVWLPPGTY